MSEVSVIVQMFNSLSAEDKATVLRLLGLPAELTEIIDSETLEEFLVKHRFPHNEVCVGHFFKNFKKFCRFHRRVSFPFDSPSM